MPRKRNRVNFFDRTIALTAAVVVFGGFAAFLWTSNSQPEEVESIIAFDADEIATIAASTVTPAQIQQQKDEILKKEEDQKRKEQENAAAEKKKLEDLKKAQADEKKKLDAIKEEKAKQEQAKKEAEEAAIALKKKQEDDEKKRQLDEQKRKEQEEKDRKAKELADAEQKKKDEAEQKRLDEEAAKKARQDELAADLAREINAQQEAENALQQQALNEQSAIASTTLEQRYASRIQEKINSNFSSPPGAFPRQEAQIEIRLDEFGNVLSRRILVSSGDRSYDQSVLDAVSFSSPFELPNDNPVVKKRLQYLQIRKTL